MRVWPGSPNPLGATWDGEGVNFALYSAHATAVTLCLYDNSLPSRETARVALQERTQHVWHVYLPDCRPGQLYGYRVEGPYDPSAGLRFNPRKLLLDPYAKAIAGTLAGQAIFCGYPTGDPLATSPNAEDSAMAMAKCVVVDEAFTWENDRPPQIPWNHTVIYECHVKGLTCTHPGVPSTSRGTYWGLASEPMLEHYRRLGITALQLLPVHHVITETGLAQRGLVNYWGYNTAGFFAPDARFARGAHGQQVQEFKSMVKALHRAGIEVLLDVVYNHTGEGDHLGPTVCWRGIDNPTYYRLQADPRYYEDFTGCGNTLNIDHPRARQLVLDSLRYWVTHMHVDGFRFDLAPTLGRDDGTFRPDARFLSIIQQDPVLSRVKLIAEPWDLGPHGHQLGNFPPEWAEWNDAYRNTVRRFWRGEGQQLADLAYRLTGSSDVSEKSGRGPGASINFVTCHDGFSLADLTSYSEKHNLANGQDNRDGSDENCSANWGQEGPSADPAINALRARMVKNFFATLAFSQGVPMLRAGDELGQSQQGNNNAYCHDSPLTWIHWQLDGAQRQLLAFVSDIMAIRRNNPVLRRRHFFRGQTTQPQGNKDVTWLRSDGSEMQDDQWTDPAARTLGMLIDAQATDEMDERGRLQHAETVLLLLNADDVAHAFVLPPMPHAGRWHVLLDTRDARAAAPIALSPLPLAPQTLVLLQYTWS